MGLVRDATSPFLLGFPLWDWEGYSVELNSFRTFEDLERGLSQSGAHRAFPNCWFQNLRMSEGSVGK